MEILVKMINSLLLKFFIFYSLVASLVSCIQQKKIEETGLSIQQTAIDSENKIICTDSMCSGVYEGVEFNKDSSQSDVAHQFSNAMSREVGNQLKKMFIEGKYSAVDFDQIIMTTKGMNQGKNQVIFELKIPFKRVQNKCDAMTAFDHCGGWGHIPALKKRKEGFLKSEKQTVVGNKLEISTLKTTPEGLQEYWIQWKHMDYQKDCE